MSVSSARCTLLLCLVVCGLSGQQKHIEGSTDEFGSEKAADQLKTLAILLLVINPTGGWQITPASQRRAAVMCARAPTIGMTSVTGTVYSGPQDRPIVTLFTREGCTLCDKAKDVLKTAAADSPHTLKAVDITDEEHRDWFDRYQYDIPVLHINGIYWAKHRISTDAALEALAAADRGELQPQSGEPNAAEYEMGEAEEPPGSVEQAKVKA